MGGSSGVEVSLLLSEVGQHALGALGLGLYQLDYLALPFAEVQVYVLLLHYDGERGQGQLAWLEVDHCVGLVKGC